MRDESQNGNKQPDRRFTDLLRCWPSWHLSEPR